MPPLRFKSFSCETGTSLLHAHLMKFHLAQWVDSCDQLKIPITAEIAKHAVASYHASKGQSSSQSTSLKERPEDICEYSYEAFVDAITQFIIADDQVQLWLLRRYVLDKIFYHSHWTSLKSSPTSNLHAPLTRSQGFQYSSLDHDLKPHERNLGWAFKRPWRRDQGMCYLFTIEFLFILLLEGCTWWYVVHGDEHESVKHTKQESCASEKTLNT